MSTVPEVLAALATLGVATLPNSQVINGPSTGVPITKGRLLLIGDDEFEVELTPDSLAGTTHTERYVVPCSVSADVQNTPDQSVADTQAWADFEALDAAITANASLGLSGSFSLNAMVVAPRFARLGTSDGRHALVRFGVDVYAAND